MTKGIFMRIMVADCEQFYGDHPTKLLKMKYPEFDWKIFKFKQTTKKFWANPENTLDYLNWLYREIRIIFYGRLVCSGIIMIMLQTMAKD